MPRYAVEWEVVTRHVTCVDVEPDVVITPALVATLETPYTVASRTVQRITAVDIVR